MAPLRALIIRLRSSNRLPMDSETLPISESGYCLRFLTLISPLTGRTSKQPVPKSRHELLNKTYLIFLSVLLDEEPKISIIMKPITYMEPYFSSFLRY